MSKNATHMNHLATHHLHFRALHWAHVVDPDESCWMLCTTYRVCVICSWLMCLTNESLRVIVGFRKYKNHWFPVVWAQKIHPLSRHYRILKNGKISSRTVLMKRLNPGQVDLWLWLWAVLTKRLRPGQIDLWLEDPKRLWGPIAGRANWVLH